jgi:UDP-3-O-[3-hydroxymyristoyl] glucosamine N-acyltransferase
MPSYCDKPMRKLYTLGEIAACVGAELKGDSEVRIGGVSPLETASPEHISFLTDKRLAHLVPQCRAAAILVGPEFGDLARPLLVCGNPYLALAHIVQMFSGPPALSPGVHRRAHIGEDVELGEGAAVGALAHVGDGCRVGRNTNIYGGAYLGNRVRVGENCLLYPGVVVLDDCRLGNNVIIHSGTVIGGDGFGFAQDEEGRSVKIPQTGAVRIEDDVEIGANCAIDRAAFGETRIGRGAKIDNLVQIGHNVVVGEHSILIAQVGVAGSTRLGRNVVLAGQVGVTGHIEVGDGVRIGAQGGIMDNIKAGETLVGSPAVPVREYFQAYAIFRRLPQMRGELRRMRKEIQKLEERLNKD